MRPLNVYHGKVGRGLSVEMSVRHGPVTLLSVVETPGLKFLVAEAESVPGPILEIGNTNSRYRFDIGAREFLNAWNAEGPAHHCAIGVGHLAQRIEKLGHLLGIPTVRIGAPLLGTFPKPFPMMNTLSVFRYCAFAAILCFLSLPLPASDLAEKFLSPPDSARPWVYWFWNNGNVTKKGITADLEAMRRAGIGGVIIMDVFERFAPPPGTADFMNPEWRELFRFSVAEAHRLGLEINMTNGPGWTGSSGPWITPSSRCRNSWRRQSRSAAQGVSMVNL